jgi:bacillithiol biosynthesis deacetylase BshB1
MELEKVHILAIGAHPDDVELSCSGSLMKAIDAGKKVGLLDLTQGELGTRGSAALRLKEAEASRKLMGAAFRVNLGMKDGFFSDDEAHQLPIIEVIRACQPDIVLVNAPRDRHPDHGKGAQLEHKACFLSGLRRIETSYNGQAQEAWRPRLVLNYIQDYFIEPQIVVDISGYWERKMEAIMCFGSQFYDPNSDEPESSISSKAFLDVLKGRAQTFGRYASFEYGEGFVADRPIGVGALSELF